MKKLLFALVIVIASFTNVYSSETDTISSSARLEAESHCVKFKNVKGKIISIRGVNNPSEFIRINSTPLTENEISIDLTNCCGVYTISIHDPSKALTIASNVIYPYSYTQTITF
jgi:hypothetical protein